MVMGSSAHWTGLKLFLKHDWCVHCFSYSKNPLDLLVKVQQTIQEIAVVSKFTSSVTFRSRNVQRSRQHLSPG